MGELREIWGSRKKQKNGETGKEVYKNSAAISTAGTQKSYF